MITCSCILCITTMVPITRCVNKDTWQPYLQHLPKLARFTENTNRDLKLCSTFQRHYSIVLLTMWKFPLQCKTLSRITLYKYNQTLVPSSKHRYTFNAVETSAHPHKKPAHSNWHHYELRYTKDYAGDKCCHLLNFLIMANTTIIIAPHSYYIILQSIFIIVNYTACL